MIKEARKVIAIGNAQREAWFFSKVCLIGLKLNIPKGGMAQIYAPKPGDFVSGDNERGAILPLKTCTMIAPGGEIRIHNKVMSEPVAHEGGLYPVGHGIHPVAEVFFEGVAPNSVMHCVSPREDRKGFLDKELEWETLDAGESLTFREGIIGFVTVYTGDEDEFKVFTAEPGDTYTAKVDSVLAVVYRRDER